MHSSQNGNPARGAVLIGCWGLAWAGCWLGRGLSWVGLVGLGLLGLLSDTSDRGHAFQKRRSLEDLALRLRTDLGPADRGGAPSNFAQGRAGKGPRRIYKDSWSSIIVQCDDFIVRRHS